MNVGMRWDEAMPGGVPIFARRLEHRGDSVVLLLPPDTLTVVYLGAPNSTATTCKGEHQLGPYLASLRERGYTIIMK